jgi:predicted enzyme related to lactoylglutathione lyase
MLSVLETPPKTPGKRDNVNTIIWADIPVTDMNRAKRFYAALLGIQMQGMPGAEDFVAVPESNGEGDISFDLAKNEGFEPSAKGVRIYFDPKGDMGGMLARAEAAGGKVVQQPQDMGLVVGTIAFLIDSEGNMIGLRERSAAPGT